MKNQATARKLPMTTLTNTTPSLSRCQPVELCGLYTHFQTKISVISATSHSNHVNIVRMSKKITRCCNHRVFSDAITKPKEACMLGRLCGIFHIRLIFLPRIPNDCRTRQGGLVLNCPYPHKFQSLFLTKLTKSINSAVLQNRPSILSMYGRQLNESPVCAQLCKVLCSSLDLE